MSAPQTFTLVHVRNPFAPLQDRSVSTRSRRVRLATLAPKTNLPFLCLVNGDPVLRADWDKRPAHGDIVCFVTLPQGGGGGGSNPLQMVAMIALTYFTMGAGAALWMPTGMAGTLGGAMLGTAAFMAGSALINAILPPPRPPTPQQAAALAAPSPTYSLGAQGNSGRLGSAIPVQYGRHIAYPDFAADPYAEFVGNEQFLYQLFVLGQGDYSIEAIRIEDTPIASFEEITYEVVPPGGSVTLFPSNVQTSVEVSGQEALTSVALGPFIVNASGTLANYLGIDVVCPKGLFYATDSGGLSSKSISFTVEAQTVDANGAPLGTWATLGTETITAATNTAQRMSYRYAVTEARYQVRLTRTDTKDTSSRAGHDLNWVGLRAYLPGAQAYGNLTLIAMRMRASNSLSAQASRKINVISTRKLPTWNPTTGWGAATATRSIAWAFADACRADYGGKLADAQIPLAQLYALHTIWTTRGDTFDGRFDNTQTLWEALTQIARVGRAKPYQQGGAVQIVRDQVQSVPVAMFSPRNTVRGSLTIDYLMPTNETADAVTVSYFDASTWRNADVTAALPGSTSDKPVTVQLFGCTSRDQAYREGMYMAACNHYRRKPITLTTEMEGFIPTFGDLVAISSERLTRSMSGEVTGWDAVNKILTLSEPLTWTTGQLHYFGLRRRDGSFSGPWQASAGIDEYHAVLAATPDFTPYVGSNEERTYFTFGIGTAHSQPALVVAARPRGNNQVQLSLINEDALVHAADSGAVPTPPTAWGLPKVPTVPAVTGLNVVQGGTPAAPVLSISWQPASGADHYLVEQSADGIAWTGAGTPTTTSTSLSVHPGTIHIRVAAIGLTRGAWAYWTGSAGAVMAPPSNVTGLALAEAFTGPVCNVIWDSTARTLDYTVEVWAAGVLRRSRVVAVAAFSYSAADAKTDGGPWRDLTFKVRGNGTGTTSAGWASLVVNNPQIGLLNNIVVTGMLTSLRVEYQAPADADFAGVMVWVSTVNGFTPSAANLKYTGPASQVSIDTDPSTINYYLRIAGFDQWGQDLPNLSAQYIAATTLIGQTQFASGIEPVSLVATNPTVKSTNIIFNTVDGKLYRWDGTAYVASVSVAASDIIGVLTDAQLAAISAAKLTGQITSTQITDGAISTAKLAAGAVTANEIAANSIIAGKIAAGAVTATELSTGAVTTAKLAAGAVTANEIAANSIVAGKIAAGAVSAAQIAAGAISTTHLAANVVTADKINGYGLSVTNGLFSGAINVGDFTGYAWPAAGGTGVHLSSNGILCGNPTPSTGNPLGKYFQVHTPAGGTPGIYTNIPAYLENAQVSTLKIAGNAATIAVSASVAGADAVCYVVTAYPAIAQVIGQVSLPNASWIYLQSSLNGAAWSTMYSANLAGYSSGVLAFTLNMSTPGTWALRMVATGTGAFGATVMGFLSIR